MSSIFCLLQSACKIFFPFLVNCVTILNWLIHYILSDGVDEYAVSKFLSHVFNNESHGKICSIVKESASCKYDMKEEVFTFLALFLRQNDLLEICCLPKHRISIFCRVYVLSAIQIAVYFAILLCIRFSGPS